VGDCQPKNARHPIDVLTMMAVVMMAVRREVADRQSVVVAARFRPQGLVVKAVVVAKPSYLYDWNVDEHHE
jgi:hypothetical protein